MRPPKPLHSLTRFGSMVVVCYFMHFKFHVSIICLCIVVITLLPINCFYACVVVG